MSRDPPMSRRAVLKLTALGGAGLVAAACSDGVGPTRPEGGVRLTTPEQPPLPGRPPNVRVSRDEFVAHAEPCLAVNPRDFPRLTTALETGNWYGFSELREELGRYLTGDANHPTNPYGRIRAIYMHAAQDKLEESGRT